MTDTFLPSSIPGIGQLQPTRMPQGSGSAGFTMSELMNILLEPIPEPNPEPSLLHSDSSNMDDIFSGFPDFESQFSYLQDHFFPQIDWGRVRLCCHKLRLFVGKTTTLGVEHKVGGLVRILESQIEVIARWPVPKDVTGVRSFLGSIGITR